MIVSRCAFDGGTMSRYKKALVPGSFCRFQARCNF